MNQFYLIWWIKTLHRYINSRFKSSRLHSNLELKAEKLVWKGGKYNQNSYFIWLQTKLVPRNTLWSFTFTYIISPAVYHQCSKTLFFPSLCMYFHFQQPNLLLFFNLTLIGKVLAEKSCWLWISDFFFFPREEIGQHSVCQIAHKMCEFCLAWQFYFFSNIFQLC